MTDQESPREPDGEGAIESARGTADSTSSAAAALLQSTLFGPLGEDDRAWVLARVEPAHYPAGTAVFARGDDAEAIFILQAGGVGISFFTSDGRKFSLAFATVGAVFGEIAVLDGGRRGGDAIALTDVDVLKLPRAAAREAMATNPRFVEAVVRFLCARVRETDQKLEAIALQSVEARLARFLLSAVRARSRGPAKSGPGSGPGIGPSLGGHARGKVAITLAISPSDLSLLIGEGQAQVSAALGLLEQAHAYERHGGDIVCDIAILSRIADQGWD